MVRVRRARIHFFAADVGGNRLPVSRILVDQPPHVGERRSDPFRVRVIEREAHAEDDAALEALPGVRLQPRRVVVAAPVEEKRGDPIRHGVVEAPHAGERSLVDVQHADHHRRQSRPRDPPARPIDLAAVRADPPQSGPSACRPGRWCWWRSDRRRRPGGPDGKRGGRSAPPDRRCRGSRHGPA